MEPNSAIYRLKRAELAVRGCVEVAFRAADVTPNQYFILLLVSSGEATSSAELARAMGVLPQSMTELLAPLEARGALVRRPDAANARVLRAELTPAGKSLFDHATRAGLEIERELMKTFDNDELDALNGLLTRLTTVAENHEFHPKLRRLATGRRPRAEAPRATRRTRSKR